jgi:pimeloyl-ACP methyl ester carboxylesterase
MPMPFTRLSPNYITRTNSSTGPFPVCIKPHPAVTITERIPGAWLVQIKGGGHGLMYEYPEQFSNIIETFLENTNTP